MESDGKIAASLPPPPPPPAASPPTLNDSSDALPETKPIVGRTSGPTRRSTRGQWTHEEDEILCAAVKRFKGKNWKKIAECFKDRTDVQCLHRWQKVLNPDLIKGPWSKEEDEIIVQLVKKYGPKKWSTIAQHLPGRIGKQCRERWHNHLNPGIKREAWTQEEELVLIRAHELTGNKWAELTKYLPGRTDNAIKNHWNSSVKKKLESYKESGLLAQFQEIPLVIYQNQSTPTTEGEEISEGSQVGCSQSQTPSDMSNAACQTIDDFIMSGESDKGKMKSTSPTPSSSEQYYSSLDDMTFTISDIPCEFTYSSYPDENISKDIGSNASDYKFGEMNTTVDLAADSCLPGNYCGTDPEMGACTPRGEERCSQIVSTQEQGDKAVVGISYDVTDMERNRHYTSFQSTYQFYEPAGVSASVFETSNNDNLSSAPSDISGQNGLAVSDKKPGLIYDGLPAYECARTKIGSPSHNPSDAGFTEQANLLESSRLVSQNHTISETSDDQQRTPTRKEGRSLCYEPPRFPSLDMPFFSCDLAQSGTDTQQDFSPLGIRRFMMSSTTSLSPFKLWDSPSSGDSPDALLKSAAKSFAGTPSILKKRHRDLMSPSDERRYGKKMGNEVNQDFLFSPGLSKEFARLGVIIDTTVEFKESASSSNNVKEQSTTSIEDKENVSPTEAVLREKAYHNHEFEAKTREKDTLTHDLSAMEKGRTLNINSQTPLNEDCVSETPRGVLVERHLNDSEFSSPVGIRKSIRQSEGDSSKYTSKEAIIFESPSFSISPLSFDHMKQNDDSEVVSTSGQPVSAVTTVMADTLVNEIGAENLNFFGGTPFRHSMESPSGWKSPWYFSSMVSCPRFEPDISFEDMGIFMSPWERSFDALGLMKQINDQGADSYADAKEVLGSETPESILRQRCSKKLNLDGEVSNVSDNPLKGRLHTTPNAMTERRVLDFSECGSPVKSTEKMKFACGGGSLPSPSCLLKSFR